MFEKAARLKLRFDTPQGKLSVEDLWELPLSAARSANLDDIAKGLNRELKNSDTEESFVKKSTPSNTVLKLKFELVKHIIAVRLTEADEAEKAQANRTRKQQILNLIAQKQDAALSEKSVEELTAMVSDL